MDKEERSEKKNLQNIVFVKNMKAGDNFRFFLRGVLKSEHVQSGGIEPRRCTRCRNSRMFLRSQSSARAICLSSTVVDAIAMDDEDDDTDDEASDAEARRKVANCPSRISTASPFA